MRIALVRAWKEWSGFWFESPAPRQMRLLGAAVGGILFLLYAIRSLDLDLLFSTSGMVPAEVVEDLMKTPYRPTLLALAPGPVALHVLNAVFLASLAALALGWRPRLASAVAFLLHVSFLHRNMISAFGVDLIATFFLLYLAIGGSVGYRLSQIQVCVIYTYSGLEKLKGTHWWRGEAVWDVLANAQLARWDFSWLADFPLLVTAATYSTLVWEIYFVAAVCNRRLRGPWLLGGVLLHAGIGLAIQIPYFSALMVATYSAFLGEEFLARRKKDCEKAMKRAGIVLQGLTLRLRDVK